MRIEHKVIYRFDNEDERNFVKYMEDNGLSYRKVAKELGVSCAYLHDMAHNHKALSKCFVEYLKKKGLFYED